MASEGSGASSRGAGDKWLETCSVHCGMELTKYCCQCEEICCETCVSDTHRSCDRICAIQEATRSMVDSGDIQDATRSMDDNGDIQDAARSMVGSGEIQEAARSMVDSGDIQDATRSMIGGGDIQEATRSMVDSGDIQDAAISIVDSGDIQDAARSMIDSRDIQEATRSMVESRDIQDAARSMVDSRDIQDAARSIVDSRDIQEATRSMVDSRNIQDTARSMVDSRDIPDAARSIVDGGDIQDAARSMVDSGDIQEATRSMVDSGYIQDAARSMVDSGDIQDAARSIVDSGDIQDAGRSRVVGGDTVDVAQDRLENICSELCRVLEDKKAQHLETTNKTKELYHKLKHVRHRIVNHIEQSEKNVMTRYHTIQQKELCFITEAENLIRDIEASMTTQQDSIDRNEQTLFVYRTRMQRLFERKDECVVKAGAIPKPGNTDDTVQDFTDTIVGVCERIPDYTATLSGRYCLREPDDEKMCTIMGSCLLKESGTILVTDWKNSKLKKLDTSYRVCESLKLTNRACDICRTDIDELAITITFKKLVQFVDIKDRIKLTRSFPVGDLCRGISYYDNKIIVLCGGFDGDGEEVTCANAGSAKLFTKRGELLQELTTDRNQAPLFKYPTHVIASRSFENFYISDERNGIAAFTKTDGKFIKMISLPDIKYPTGMYKGDGNWIYVSCYDSNTIFLVDTESAETRVLLTEEDEIKSPLTPCFDKSRSKLFVGMNSNDDVLVFDVKKIIKV